MSSPGFGWLLLPGTLVAVGWGLLGNQQKSLKGYSSSRAGKGPLIDMSDKDFLRAAARCWERAGLPERAAERWGAADDWAAAGRCWAQAGRPVEAAEAYAMAGDLVGEARQWLTSLWPERARSAYQQVLAGGAAGAAEVEALLGLGELEGALRRAFALPEGGERLEALRTLARLAASHGRFDVASPILPQYVDGCTEAHEEQERFAPWNNSLRWKGLYGRSLAPVWPKIAFRDVALVSMWVEGIESSWWGDRALDWSTDSTRFAVVFSDRLGIGQVDGSGIVRLSQPEITICVKFVPGSFTVLTGDSLGHIRRVDQDGSAFIEKIRTPYQVWSISFSPLGNRVAVSSYLGNSGARLRIHKWASGSPGEKLEDVEECGSNCSPLCVWSPEGRGLAWSSGPYYETNRLTILDNEGRHRALDAHESSITSLSFTLDGGLLISASRDQTVVIRDRQDGHPLSPPERFENSVYGSSVHPQAALLAVGEGSCLHLLRLRIGDPPRLTRLSEHPMDENVRSLAFSPDGRHLLVMTRSHLHLFRVDLKP